ncbi:MAG: hypothetical protein HYW48_05180 [Deltaproteobacteria bacterium]|nr:hypothetical protein [Deltaproteobacteria bacterium]
MKLVAFAAGLLLTGSAFAADVIEWNFNGQANALGSGCRKDAGRPGDTDFISAGNDVSVLFSRLGVSLTGDAGGAKVASKTCRFAIPTKVRAGYYIGRLQQTITYGYERNSGTSGKVSAATTFYGQTAGNLLRNIPTPGLDQWSVPFAEVRHTSLWRVNPSWCLRSDYKGNFMANLAVNGYRESTKRDIVIQINGHDIRFDAVGFPLLCP